MLAVLLKRNFKLNLFVNTVLGLGEVLTHQVFEQFVN
jgi:hypothetical protein